MINTDAASKRSFFSRLPLLGLLFVLWLITTAATQIAPIISNGDFETGDLTGWQPVGDVSVINTGLDELTNDSLQRVGNGSYAARIGDEIPWDGFATQESSLEQILTIPSTVGQDQFLQFAYAIVANDPPDHPEADKPRFRVMVEDQNVGKTIYDSEYKYTSQTSNDWYLGGKDLNQIGSLPYHFAMGDRWVYRPWKQVNIPLDGLAGHKVLIRFEVRDCNYGAHPIYGYLDSVGVGPKTQLKLPSLAGKPIKADFIKPPFWAPLLFFLEKFNVLWLCFVFPLLLLLLLWLLLRRKSKPVYSSYIPRREEEKSEEPRRLGGIRKKMD